MKNEFDDFVKKHMKDLEVAPSSEVKRALGFALFFRNLLNFHKVKMIAALALISVGSFIAVNYSSEGELDINKETSQLIEGQDYSGQESNSDKLIVENHEATAKENTLLEDENNLRDEVVYNRVGNEKVESYATFAENFMAMPVNETSEANQSSTNESVDQINARVEAVDDKKESDNANSSDETENNSMANSSRANSKAIVLSPEVSSVESGEINEVANIFKRSDIVLNKANIIESGINIETLKDCSQPDLSNSIAFDGDYANDPKRRGFSVDLYLTPYAQNKITNEIDAFYEKYHWDFYKDFDFVKSGISGGANVNYEWNGFKIGSGVNFNVINDYRPDYRYEFDDFLVPYGGDAISGVNVFGTETGEDTALVFHVLPSDNDTKEELENDNNKYTYLNIPLTLGYELHTKFVSLELNGGIEYGKIIGAKGLGIKNGEVDENPYPQGYADETYTVYYYRNKYMETINRKSSMLQKNTLGYIGNAVLRFHVSKSFDVFTSFKYKQSINGLYKYNYMIQKKYNSYGANIGVTYHLNKRMKSSSVQFD